MSMNSILSVARTALLTHQAAIEVTGHNIANAETPGYSRQELTLAASQPARTPIGTFGTGVSIVDVARARDAFADHDVRTQTTSASGSGMRQTLLQRIEAVFGEPSDTGLASAMDAFWNAWSDLASHPTNPAARTVVQQRALALTGQFNAAADRLNAIAAETTRGIHDAIGRANDLTSRIASLNVRIVAAETTGHTAGDLRDERDRLIDELATLVPVQVIDRADGSNQVMLGGNPLVDGAVAHTLHGHSGPPVTVTRGKDPSPLQQLGGALGAMLSVVNTDVANAVAALDALAAALVTDVNAIHVGGWSPPSGAGGNWDTLAPPTGSGIPFFDTAPTSLTARTIRLSSAVAANAAAIAAGDALNETGNNRIALAMQGLRDFAPSAPGGSLGEAYRNLITGIASDTRAATDAASSAHVTLQHATMRRSSVSGVSTDEEMLRLMKFQQAYAAAAKVIQVVDEMAATLLSIKA